ncbi:MAG: hypothetical protein HYY17_02925 [Planctomycetes bacterium]|nr:hypothetical protein [Planctomycetota bacterium]
MPTAATAAVYVVAGVLGILAFRELWRWLRSGRITVPRALFVLAVFVNLGYSLPREGRESLEPVWKYGSLSYDERARRWAPAEPEACAELLRRLPPGARILVVLPADMNFKDRKYLETNLNYRICPGRADYAVRDGGSFRKIAHDPRAADRATPGFFDPLQFFRPLRPDHDYLLMCRHESAEILAEYEPVGRNERATLYRRKR